NKGDWKAIKTIPAVILIKNINHNIIKGFAKICWIGFVVYLTFSSVFLVVFGFKNQAKLGSKIKSRTPIYKKVLLKSEWLMDIKNGARILDMTKAPKPKPITTIPVAKPWCLV